MRNSRIVLIALLFGRLASAQPGDFALKAGDRVVFYGDSITDQRLYTTFTESYVVTRFPTLDVSFTHSGWGGDRVGGGGGGPIDTRLERDVFPYNPTVMTIMLGMNDGGYRTLDQKLFDIFKTGYAHIVESVKQHDPQCRITVIEPSPYDDVTRAPKIEGGYNAVLLEYSAFLKQLAASQQLTVADLNTGVVAMLKRANAADPEQAQKIIPDRVHPGPAGHLIMAEGLLKAWNAPAVVTDVAINAKNGKTETQFSDLTNVKTGKLIEWDETDHALPMPIDPNDKLLAFAVDSSDFVDSLDKEMLRVAGLRNGRYQLTIDGSPVATFASSELEKGVNLARLDTPMLRQSLLVHQLTLERAGAHNIRWRNIQVPMKEESKEKKGAMDALDKLDGQLRATQRIAAQPRPHHFALIAQ